MQIFTCFIIPQYKKSITVKDMFNSLSGKIIWKKHWYSVSLLLLWQNAWDDNL